VHDRRVDDNDVEDLNRGYLLAARGVLEMFKVQRAPIVVDPEDEIPFRVCYPLTMYALNQDAAAVLLHDNGAPYSATVNVRVAFEHAIWAEWVRLTEGGPERVVSHWRANNVTAAGDLGAWTKLPPDLVDMVNAPRDAGERPSFQVVCDRFGSKKKMIYSVYRSMNTAVHPSLETLRRHLHFDVEGTIAGLSGDASAAGSPADFYWVLGWSAVLAAYVQETLQHDRGRAEQVRELARRGGLPLDLAGEDNTPDLQPPRQRPQGL
jgi:hypothetical protein